MLFSFTCPMFFLSLFCVLPNCSSLNVTTLLTLVSFPTVFFISKPLVPFCSGLFPVFHFFIPILHVVLSLKFSFLSFFCKSLFAKIPVGTFCLDGTHNGRVIHLLTHLLIHHKARFGVFFECIPQATKYIPQLYSHSSFFFFAIFVNIGNTFFLLPLEWKEDTFLHSSRSLFIGHCAHIRRSAAFSCPRVQA
jgi:hypothetical protein